MVSPPDNSSLYKSAIGYQKAMGQYEKSRNPCKVIKRGLDLLPNVITAEIVPGVGHGMVQDRPDQVIGRVTSFL